MTGPHYRSGDLYIDHVRAGDAAQRLGTPLLIYSAERIRENAGTVRAAFEGMSVRVTPAAKASPSAAVLAAAIGGSRGSTSDESPAGDASGGLCATSPRDLELAWLAGASLAECTLAGVGKREDTIQAALDGLYSPLFQAGALVRGRPPSYRGPVGLISVESRSELGLVASVAAGLRIPCRVLLRVSPELETDPDSSEVLDSAHLASQSKFGMTFAEAERAVREFAADPVVSIAGVHMHLSGGPISVERFGVAATRLATLFVRLRNMLPRDRRGGFDTIDLGGGFPLANSTQSHATPAEYAAAAAPVAELARGGARVIIEPGRAVFGSAGVLLTRVLDVSRIEDRRVVICDSGLEPGVASALAGACGVAWPMTVDPANEPPTRGSPAPASPAAKDREWYDVVGPAASDYDAIARGRQLPPVSPGDVVAVFDAGAYPARIIPREQQDPVAEALVDGYGIRLTRPRHALADRLAPDIESANRPTA